jgi:hypothetical protein
VEALKEVMLAASTAVSSVALMAPLLVVDP